LSAYWFFTGGLSPLFRREVWDLEARVQVGRELAPEQGAKVGAESELNDVPRGRVLAQDVPDRSLGVEQRTDRATGQDPVAGLALRAIWYVVVRGGATPKSVFITGNGASRNVETQPGADRAKTSRSHTHPRKT